MYSDKQIKDMETLLRRIMEVGVQLCIGYQKEEGNILSPKHYSEWIHSLIGTEYDFLVDVTGEKVTIVDTENHMQLGHLCCRQNPMYRRGDTREAAFLPDWAELCGALYIQDKRIGELGEYVYEVEEVDDGEGVEDVIYYLEKLAYYQHRLYKYNISGEMLWETPILRGYSNLSFSNMTYHEGFPENILVLSEGGSYLVYDCDVGCRHGVYKENVTFEDDKSGIAIREQNWSESEYVLTQEQIVRRRLKRWMDSLALLILRVFLFSIIFIFLWLCFTLFLLRY